VQGINPWFNRRGFFLLAACQGENLLEALHRTQIAVRISLPCFPRPFQQIVPLIDFENQGTEFRGGNHAAVNRTAGVMETAHLRQQMIGRGGPLNIKQTGIGIRHH
jgi:hypothetical protein